MNDVESPDILPTRLTRLRVMRAARFAALREQPLTMCPYDPGSSDDIERVLARTWVKTYLRCRPTPEAILDGR